MKRILSFIKRKINNCIIKLGRLGNCVSKLFFEYLIWSWYKYIYWKTRLDGHNRTNVYLFGVPMHGNLGDSAIELAEEVLLLNCGINKKNIKTIITEEFEKDWKVIRRFIGKERLLFYHGGGNMGNEWPRQEIERRQLLTIFPNNPWVIFPQTFYYQGENKDIDEKNSIPFYIGRKNLTLIAREKVSYDRMMELYAGTDLLLIPDIVLYTDKKVYGITEEHKRNGIIFCTRSDSERMIEESVWIQLKRFVENIDEHYLTTDMVIKKNITNDVRMQCVADKMIQFSKSKLVITDRLHAMIFSAITETPCIVFQNYNHKIIESYEWIRYLKYIHFVKTIADAKRSIYELLNYHYCSFDNTPLMKYYERLIQVIKHKYKTND